MSVVIKGSEPFDIMIASNIVNCQTANIKFKNISFRCETIEDADGTVFVKMPSAQPDVIRCKDCKYYEWTGNRIPEEQTWWCYKYNTEMGNNDYCSYGERRGGDGNG